MLSQSSLQAKAKELKKSYVDAMKEYSRLKGDEKKQAQKPMRPAVRKVKILNDRDSATRLVTALRQKHDKRQIGKRN